MSVVVSPPPSIAPFPVPPIALSPPSQLPSPVPESQPNATAPPVSSLPPTLPPQSAPPPVSPPQSPPPSNVTSPPPSAPQSPPLSAPQSPPPSAPQSPLPPAPQSPPPSNVISPPPMASPPTASASPPLPSSPPPSPAASSPPPKSSPPPASSSPPQSSPPPVSSPPPPSSPPVSASPPPKVEPPPVSPPPQPTPPTSSPPPPPKFDPPPTASPPQSTNPPSSPSPPPKIDPPPVSPPPPAQNPDPEPPKGSSPAPPSPVNSPPPPASVPPQGSPPTPPSDPPKDSPPSPLPPANSPPSPSFPPPRDSPPTPSSEPSRNTPPSPPVPSGGSGTPTNGSSGNAADSSNSPSSNGIGTGGTVAIGIIVAVLLLSVIGVVGWCVWKRKKKAFHGNGGNGTGNNFLNSPGGLGNSKIWFTYEELVKATNDFSAENILGAGGFGSVYKGRLPDGRDVAVKQLDIGGRQGDREFRAEVEIISRVHHRHLVSLVGYCISDNRRLLVYEYVPNNTLYFHLHAKGRPVLDWATRVKIAIGAARGIAYLHEDCHPRIIHRDIKSSNILLDINFDARVSDFGLAKLVQDVKTHVTTRVAGTFGYMAPEYASSGKLTEKSDVYSFGVVLLELITGRKPVDTSQPIGDESLVEWARPLLTHALEKLEFDQLADPCLERNYVIPEMFQLIEAAAACVRPSAAKRPGMGQIMRAFDNMSTSDLTNGMKVGESRIYNSAEQSAEIRLSRRMTFGSPDFSSDCFTPR